jgi:hypothetical protein
MSTKKRKVEQESLSEAGTQEKKEETLSEKLSRTLSGFTDTTEQDSGGSCIIVGYHQKPKS